jgi:hypothetical protein
MADYTWGRKTSGPEQVVSPNASMKPGRVYKVSYAATGLYTILPINWEEKVAAQIRQNLQSQYPGCTLTYIHVNSYLKTADVEFTYSEAVTPHIEPLTAIIITVVCITIVAGLLLSLYISGNIKEILIGTGTTPGAASQVQNIVMYAAIGVVAIAGAIVLPKIIDTAQSFRSEATD